MQCQYDCKWMKKKMKKKCVLKTCPLSPIKQGSSFKWKETSSIGIYFLK